MEHDTDERPIWQQILIGFVGSLAVNVAYGLLAPQDQRVVLMVFFTVLVGMVLLLGARTGAYGMGILLGAAGAVAVVVTGVILWDWAWLDPGSGPLGG